MHIARITVLMVALIIAALCSAQSLQVTEISIEGNNKTKGRVILRELDFAVGDSIQQENLSRRLDRNRNQLLKTGLFTDVTLNITQWDTNKDQIAVGITVAESWYIFPVPLFELADRNFNVWWTEQNRSLSRVNIGMRVYLLNLNGINDQLKFKMQVGYTPKFEVTYLIPFINRRQTIGLEFNVLRSVNKEIPLLNRDNKQVFFDLDDMTIFRRSRIRFGTSYRPDLHTGHSLRVEYHNHAVNETLVNEYNPAFFLDGQRRQEFIALEYQLIHDKRNRSIFPTAGWYAQVNVEKKGLGIFQDISTLAMRPAIEGHLMLTQRWTAHLSVQAKWSLLRDQVPYYNYRGLGFLDNYLRGYELYVVDGLDYIYFKPTIAFKVLESSINWKRKMPISSFRIMPWQMYLSINYDIGHVNDPFYSEKNSFTNRWLHGGGLGVNILLYNLFQLQVEFSANHLGEKGLFLHTKTSF